MIVSAGGYWTFLAALLYPAALLFFLAALLSEAGQTGVRVSGAAVIRLERLSPSAGMKRLLSSQSVFEAARALAVWSCGLVVLGYVLWTSLPSVLASGSGELLGGFALLGETLSRIGFWLIVLAWVAALADLFAVRMRWWKRHSMDLEELRKEMKDTEGNAEVKMMRRHLHQELIAHSHVEAVRNAKVLLVKNAGKSMSTF